MRQRVWFLAMAFGCAGCVDSEPCDALVCEQQAWVSCVDEACAEVSVYAYTFEEDAWQGYILFSSPDRAGRQELLYCPDNNVFEIGSGPARFIDDDVELTTDSGATSTWQDVVIDGGLATVAAVDTETQVPSTILLATPVLRQVTMGAGAGDCFSAVARYTPPPDIDM